MPTAPSIASPRPRTAWRPRPGSGSGSGSGFGSGTASGTASGNGSSLDSGMDALSSGAGAAHSTPRVPAELARESPPTQTLRSRRRPSIPSSSARASALSVDTSSSRAKKQPQRSANYIRTQAASPEVISSLIDQLSAISASTQSHFDRLPATAARETSPAAAAAAAADDETGRPPYHRALRDQNDVYPDDDDACEPPVVRTSKPPSGRSPITAPPPRPRKDKAHSLASYLGRSAGSSASLHSCHSARSHRSSTSFGAISIDAAPHASKPVPDSARSSAESRRSVKRPRSLMYMSSRERLKQKETDTRKRLDDASPDSPRKPAAQLFPYEDTIKEEPYVLAREDDPYTIAREEIANDDDDDDPYTITQQGLASEDHTAAESSRSAHRYPSRNASPARRIRMNLVDGPQREPLIDHLVPDRGSSLRHASPTKKSRKSSASRSTSKGKGKEAERPKTVPEQPPTPTTDPEEDRKQRLLRELEQEENEVAQRIKQLREQKLLREKTAAKLPAHAPAGTGSAVKPHVSGLPSPEASPTSVVSPSSEAREDCTKAHRLLGISLPPMARSSTESELNKPLPSIEPREPTRPAPLPPHLRHSRHRSLTVNDGDDLPLPINYALALKSLDTSAPNSPRTPRVDSTQMTLPPHPGSSSASAKRADSSSASTRRADSSSASTKRADSSSASTKRADSSSASTKRADSSSASTKRADSSREGLKRSSSLSVGGRSALGRKANSMVMDGPQGHKHSSSLTEGKPATFRSASEEISSGRHSSLSMASASNSFTLQQKKTLTKKKKRWSHPDLPAKAEKAHNDRVDRQEAKDDEARKSQASHYVMNPWIPVIEERPSSLDSIDMDVDAYLRAPRLSQKIRHPQTGRIISFSEVGDPNGFAIFVCVGMGLTRFVMAFYDQLAATLKLRLITPERPGVGASQVDPNGTPLTWPDDVLHICQALKITKFSLLAHSAGAIYALATSLRMPQHIRGRVHLLAPWIPPSQMAPLGMGHDSPPTQQLPRSQRFLRALPPSLLRLANSTFLSETSASLQRTGPAKAPKPRRKSTAPGSPRNETPPPRPSLKDNRRESMLMMDQVLPNASTLTLTVSHTHDSATEKARLAALSAAELDRQRAFDERLTFAIWDRATLNANPATDLIVCLETKQTIGFRYEDINRPVVIHHGSKDSRVPVDNVRWLGKVMRKTEVRVLEGEQHGLMAQASVMGAVLEEMGQEWRDWTSVVRQASAGDLRGAARRKASFA